MFDGVDASALRRAEPIGFRTPMLATLTDRRFDDPGWIFERKLDGVRAIVTRDGAEITLWSRNRNRVNNSYPEIAEALSETAPERFVADGEIVAFEGNQTSFSRLQRRMHSSNPERSRATGVAVHIYLFDLLVLGDIDLSGLPLRTRKNLLRETFTFEDPIRFSTHRNADGTAYLDEACRRGWEGLIAKRADSTYRPGRTRDWLKLKCVHGQEFVIGGYTEPSGSRSGFGALLVGYYDGSALRYAGKVGTGFDNKTLDAIYARLVALEVDRSPFAEVVKEKGAHWIRPDLVGQVGFGEWTSDGRLRHPRFQGLRTDKKPAEVVREDPTSAGS